jgi:hypothetical protein
LGRVIVERKIHDERGHAQSRREIDPQRRPAFRRDLDGEQLRHRADQGAMSASSLMPAGRRVRAAISATTTPERCAK